MMPLFHVGGIVRNPLSPIAGGGTVLAPAFNAGLIMQNAANLGVRDKYSQTLLHC